MTPLSIVAFMDGRLGHEKQTRGLLQAITARTAVQTETVHLPATSLASAIRSTLAYASARIAPAGQPVGQGKPDLIIGTGSRTHIPMVLYKKKNGGRIVTCMTPDLYIRRSMDLCLVPRHDRIKPAENIFVTIGPPGTGRDSKVHDDGKGLILIGGIDEKSHIWDSRMAMDQIQTIFERAPDVRWTISSSPRTPEQMEQLLEHFAERNGRVRFFRSKDTPSGWIEGAYAENRWVWVTADSISMVYEALTAGCRVGILPVRWKKEHNKFQSSIDYLVRARMAVTYGSWLQGWKPESGIPLDEAGRCADEILRRWWPDRR